MKLSECPKCAHPWSSHFAVARFAEKYGCQGPAPVDRGEMRADKCGCKEMPPKINCADCLIAGMRCRPCREKELAAK